MDKYPIFPGEAGYSKEELRGIWRRFRRRRDAAKILADFALVDQYQAMQLVREFQGEEPFPEPDAPSQFPPAPHGPQDFEF